MRHLKGEFYIRNRPAFCVLIAALQLEGASGKGGAENVPKTSCSSQGRPLPRHHTIIIGELNAIEKEVAKVASTSLRGSIESNCAGAPQVQRSSLGPNVIAPDHGDSILPPSSELGKI